MHLSNAVCNKHLQSYINTKQIEIDFFKGNQDMLSKLKGSYPYYIIGKKKINLYLSKYYPFTKTAGNCFCT